MTDRLSIFSMIAALSLSIATSAAAAPTAAPTYQEKAAIVAALNESLSANYAFPQMAEKIAPILQQHLESGDYDSARTKDELAKELTEDLIEISGDFHFFVGVDPQWIADLRRSALSPHSEAMRRARAEKLEETNFGFDEVRRLDGNIGYIRFSYFADPDLAYDTAAAAMRFVQNSDAVIFDLRYNNGGYLEMAQFLASYFFTAEKDQLLFDYDYKENGKRIERGQWVLSGLPGKRMVDKPVYILTGSTSFSSAEWFSYSMQKLGRATLIGERTAGGAHPVDRKPIDDDFFVQVPIGQIRDPVDHGDFEGTGVQPDIQIASIDALAVAQKMALEKLSISGVLEKADYDWLLPVLAAQTTHPDVDISMFKSLAGQYDGRKIALENGTLFYIWRGRLRVALQPIAPNLFAVEGVTDFRYRFGFENDKVTSLERVNKDGSIQAYRRID